jgi:hypothetical protein
LIRPGERCGFAVLDAKGRAKLCGKPPTCERMIDGILFTACDACAARHDAGQGARDMSNADRLDLADPAAVHAWLADLRVAVDDADAVTRDALRPLGRRELGRALHRHNYREARERIVALLAHAEPSPPEGEPGAAAPAGNSNPIH